MTTRRSRKRAQACCKGSELEEEGEINREMKWKFPKFPCPSRANADAISRKAVRGDFVVLP